MLHDSRTLHSFSMAPLQIFPTKGQQIKTEDEREQQQNSHRDKKSKLMFLYLQLMSLSCTIVIESRTERQLIKLHKERPHLLIKTEIPSN